MSYNSHTPFFSATRSHIAWESLDNRNIQKAVTPPNKCFSLYRFYSCNTMFLLCHKEHFLHSVDWPYWGMPTYFPRLLQRYFDIVNWIGLRGTIIMQRFKCPVIGYSCNINARFSVSSGFFARRGKMKEGFMHILATSCQLRGNLGALAGFLHDRKNTFM